MNDLEHRRLMRLKDEIILRSLTQWLNLTPKERDCLALRVGLNDGVIRDVKSVATIYGVTPGRVKTIERRAIVKLRLP